MLKNLIIKNIALIENADIAFDKGLNILSGETGAGKSVILDSLNFVLGAKADKTMIRHGQDFCSVKAIFDISSNTDVLDELVEQGLEQDDFLTIFRRFSLNSGSEVKVNGESISVSGLRKLTSKLVDLHGQSEHFYLLKESNQLELIDKYAGDMVLTIKNSITEKVKKLKEINKNLDALGGNEQQRAIKLDILQYQVNEIIKTDFKENEDTELLELKEKLQNQSRITDALNFTKQALSSENGSVDTISDAKAYLGTISNYSQEYANLFERIDNLYAELSDISDAVASALDNFDFSEYDLDRVNERLSEIKKLKTKYGTTFEDINAFLTSAQDEIEQITHFDELAEQYLNDKEIISSQIYKLYDNLNKIRKECANDFAKKIITEIRELNMQHAEFSVDFKPLPPKQDCDCLSVNGIDEVEFLFSANLGEPLKPLSKIVSGGEISRFMLAIKSQTAKFNNVSTFVFDEIDAGISGTTATIVGEKFIKLSNDVQIIAITHLPQIASMGDNNLLIKKTETTEKTFTDIIKLSDENKIIEVLRLIGGTEDDTTAIQHATNLISHAKELKSKYSK